MRAIRFDHFGDVDVLRVADVPTPEPGGGEIRVRVSAAGINPGESLIRTGALEAMFPTTFPCGQGTDFAGRVDAVGPGVTAFRVGDEVLGYNHGRAAQADYVISDAAHLAAKPRALDWIRAGSMQVAGATAYAAVRAVAPASGSVVAVSGAAGGVGSIAVQLAKRAGARVLGIASDANDAWLRSVGVEQVAYGAGLGARLRELAPHGIDGFIDAFGGGYVDLACELGVARDRIDTVIDFAAAGRLGVKTDGAAAADGAGVLGELAELVAWGEILMPIAAVYPLERVHDAYRELARRHGRGKIVFDLTLPADAPAQRFDGARERRRSPV